MLCLCFEELTIIPAPPLQCQCFALHILLELVAVTCLDKHVKYLVSQKLDLGIFASIYQVFSIIIKFGQTGIS